MNTEAKPSVRKDALVATLVLASLGVLWLVFRLYWQGLLLLVAAGLVAYLGAVRSRDKAEPPAGDPPKPTRADAPRRAKKRRRRK